MQNQFIISNIKVEGILYELWHIDSNNPNLDYDRYCVEISNGSDDIDHVNLMVFNNVVFEYDGFDDFLPTPCVTLLNNHGLRVENDLILQSKIA